MLCIHYVPMMTAMEASGLGSSGPPFFFFFHFAEETRAQLTALKSVGYLEQIWQENAEAF